MEAQRRILWVDDEIDLLRPHIILLEQRGYLVSTSSNGADAIEMVRRGSFGLVFLDESMVGMSGLEVLEALKSLDASLPVVMVTKNEQESLMDEAIGRKIDDYLTKPVNPAQILAACKKFLESRRIAEQKFTQDYFKGFNELSARLSDRLTWEDWVDIYQKLVQWSIDLDLHPDLGFQQTLTDQWQECNRLFSKYVADGYTSWLGEKPTGGSPLLSPHLLDEFVLPRIRSGRKTVMFVIDCMRLDQWLVMEEFIRPLFSVSKRYYSSILPTATPYARNSIFSGLYPADIAKHYPSWAPQDSETEHSQNAHEKELLEAYVKRRFVELQSPLQYVKIIDTDFGKRIENDLHRIVKSPLTAIVVNAVDMIAHSRSDHAILREIAPDESAYRSLTRSWFQHSSFFGMLRILSGMKDVDVIITTDHGSIRCLHGVKVMGDRDTTTNLRYKMGRNVKAEERHAMIVKNPEQLRLPKSSVTSNMIIAKEDFFFVYPTEYHHYLNKYKDGFQHGGISMEEMILPVVILEPKS
jgi:CheY-like chemotaxis protein